MMTSLPARATALRERLVELDRMSSNVDEAANLEVLRTEIAAGAGKLRAQLDKQAILVDANIAVSAPPSLIKVRKRAAGLLERFLTDIKAATLKKGQGWAALPGEIDLASRDLADAVLSAWRAHRETVFAGDTPASLRVKLARTKTNDLALATYQTLYARLKAVDLPGNKDDIDQVAALAAKLEDAARAFNFDVPAEVKQFLEGVLSVTGAPLTLLTPIVRQWLEANGGLESYTIRSSGRG